MQTWLNPDEFLVGHANDFIRDLLHGKISEISIIGLKKISSLDKICRLANIEHVRMFRTSEKSIA